MGYNTDFYGKFILDKPLSIEDFTWLIDFNHKRHDDGDYPGYYCQWIPNKDGTAIVYDGGEKFYNYVEWIEYLVKNFFEPRGYVLNGEVMWDGEEHGDVGVIRITDNVVVEKQGRIVYD